MSFGIMVSPIVTTMFFGGVGGYIFGALHKSNYLSAKEHGHIPITYSSLTSLMDTLIGATGALIVVALAVTLTQFDFTDIYSYYVPENDTAQTIEQRSSFIETYLVLIGLSLIGGFASIRVFCHAGSRLVEELKNQLASTQHQLEDVQEDIQTTSAKLTAYDYLVRGTSRLDDGYFDEAIKLFEKSIGLNPSVRAYSNLAYAQGDAGYTPEKCIQTINKGLELIDEDTDNSGIAALHYNRANYKYFAYKDDPEALNREIDSIYNDLESSLEYNSKLADIMVKDEELAGLREISSFNERFGTILNKLSKGV